MTDLKDAIFDAKYVEMIGLADYIVKDCMLPDEDADGNPMAGQMEIAAAIFRWAVTQRQAERGEEPAAPAPLPPQSSTFAAPDQNFVPMTNVQPAPYAPAPMDPPMNAMGDSPMTDPN